MSQLEYGDYYKFVASAGIALLVAAVLLPWVFLHETFDLSLETAKIALLTPEAQSVIRTRQSQVALIIKFVPCVSGTFPRIASRNFVTGCVITDVTSQVRAFGF
jgi:hypothetical protein